MNSNESAYKNINSTNQKKVSRRTFFTKSVGCTVGLTLLAIPGIKTGILTAQVGKSKEEILKELEAKVDKFMPMYRSCSQVSFAALNEQFELKADQTIPALMPFAGGIVRKGETCGAVSGSMLAIGFFFESTNQKLKKQAGSSVKFGALFFDRFEQEFGSTRCKEVVKHQYGRYYDFLNQEEQKLFMVESQKSQQCMEVVKKAVLIAGNIMLENF